MYYTSTSSTITSAYYASQCTSMTPIQQLTSLYLESDNGFAMEPHTKILLVDDSPFMQELLEWQLGELKIDHDLEVLKAFNGQMGLRMMLSEQPSIVILDVNMPLKDGPDMLEDFRKSKECQGGYNPHMIALTSQTDPNTIDQLISLGVNYYYTKPFNSLALLDRLRFLLGPTAS